MSDRDQEKRDAMRWLVLRYGGPALRRRPLRRTNPMTSPLWGHPYRQRAGGVASESQPV